MYTKKDKKLMKAMIKGLNRKELLMVIEELIDVNEDQSKTIHELIGENNKLRRSEVEVEAPKEKAWKSKD